MVMPCGGFLLCGVKRVDVMAQKWWHNDFVPHDQRQIADGSLRVAL
jgi:hypothetical protein